MMTETAETTDCHRCHGTGSGVYNALSPESTCEVCGGTGIARPAPIPAASTIVRSPLS
ncbi:hypothetical protein P12x_005999 (plasmid) [Tundrisphaera lichenicola]|uniref:hypothetical protein n=1 Tax=Tundrisphaera lichenicola TaxID=2029860 RepID=UPI003EBEAEB5